MRDPGKPYTLSLGSGAKQHGGHAGFHYTDLPQGTRVEVEMPFLNA